MMSRKVQDFWDQKEKEHTQKIHSVYRTSQLYEIPEARGLYSWHLQATPLNYNDYFKVFKQKRVDVSIKGNLREAYSGQIPSTYLEKDFINGDKIDFELCEFASLVFCPPLYIGISINLRKRLVQHYNELEKIYSGEVKLEQPSKLGKTDFDTIVESSHFAQRIGFTVANMPNIRLSSFYIKTIELDSTYTWSDIQRVEKYLNRTFIPIYGRK